MTITETNFCNKMVKETNQIMKEYGYLDDSQLRLYISENFRMENIAERPHYNNIAQMKEYIFRNVKRG